MRIQQAIEKLLKMPLKDTADKYIIRKGGSEKVLIGIKYDEENEAKSEIYIHSEESESACVVFSLTDIMSDDWKITKRRKYKTIKVDEGEL